MTASLPTYMIYDDHEIQNNWSYAAFFDPNHIHFHDFDPKTYFHGVKAYLAHQAVMSPVADDPQNRDAIAALYEPDEYMNDTLGAANYYYEATHGNCVFFYMDVRGQREALPSEYAEHTQFDGTLKASMIGPSQLERLYHFLTKEENHARAKFIVSPTPFFPDYVGGFASPEDIWTGYAEQRTEIINAIARIAEQANDGYVLPIFLGGDVHQSSVSTLALETPSTKTRMELHSIVSSAFNWYIFGVQIEQIRLRSWLFGGHKSHIHLISKSRLMLG